MTTPLVDPSFAPLAQDLLACLATQVAQLANPPAVVGLRPGTQIELLLSTFLDECCEGVAWVRPVPGSFPSTQFPIQDVEASNCPTQRYALTLEMGVARCAPTPPAESLVSAQEWSELTLAIFDDDAAMRRAACCFTDGHPRVLTLVGAWAPLPIDAGCAGGMRQFTIAVDDCACDDLDQAGG